MLKKINNDMLYKCATQQKMNKERMPVNKKFL